MPCAYMPSGVDVGLQSKRPVISPNLDFMGELQQYEKSLGFEVLTPLPALEPVGNADYR